MGENKRTIWYEGSSSSHDRLKVSETGFLGPGVYLAASKETARWYARLKTGTGFVRTVEIEETAVIGEVRSRYSEDVLQEAEDEGVSVFELKGVDAIILSGREGGDELILRSADQGNIVREERVSEKG